MEEFAKRGQLDFISTLKGPRLDELPFEMVDTGKSRSRVLSGDNSFSSSRGSSTDTDVWSFTPAKQTSSAPSRKLFQIGRRKKREAQTTGWVC